MLRLGPYNTFPFLYLTQEAALRFETVIKLRSHVQTMVEKVHLESRRLCKKIDGICNYKKLGSRQRARKKFIICTLSRMHSEATITGVCKENIQFLLENHGWIVLQMNFV